MSLHISENNWYQWHYGNNEPYGLQTGNEELKFSYKRIDYSVKSYKEELLRAASSTMDHYSGLSPCVFFSGGADSELVLRAYLDIGANPKVLIIRYEDDLNLYDVSYAITICSLLNVDYTIYDFNLKKFYENDAESISEIAQIDCPRSLPYCKFLEIGDGFPVLGEGDPFWKRDHGDYSHKANWWFKDIESFIGWEKYALHLDKPAIVQFLKWTPGLVLAHTKLPWLAKLINDEYHGATGTDSTKMIGYRNAYPGMIDRAKKTGFEKLTTLVAEYEAFMKQKYNGLIYRQTISRSVDDLCLEITGKDYASTLAI